MSSTQNRLIRICGAILLFVMAGGHSEVASAQARGLVSFQSSNFLDHYLRHRQFAFAITPLRSDEYGDATFRRADGLAGRGLSFESVNYPGYFLRHENFRIVLQQYDGSDLFAQDASFEERGALTGGSGRSYESVNFPGYFLRHQNFQMKLHEYDGTSLFAGDATFNLIPALYRPQKVAPPPHQYTPPAEAYQPPMQPEYVPPQQNFSSYTAFATGRIASNQDAEIKCTEVARSVQGIWTGRWRAGDTPNSSICIIGNARGR